MDFAHIPFKNASLNDISPDFLCGKKWGKVPRLSVRTDVEKIASLHVTEGRPHRSVCICVYYTVLLWTLVITHPCMCVRVVWVSSCDHVKCVFEAKPTPALQTKIYFRGCVGFWSLKINAINHVVQLLWGMVLSLVHAQRHPPAYTHWMRFEFSLIDLFQPNLSCKCILVSS